jgi:formylmethanofuran dehydrogenase subunit E
LTIFFYCIQWNGKNILGDDLAGGILSKQQLMKKERAILPSGPAEEYLRQAEAFHGYAAPGLLLGKFMVEKARKGIPPGVLFQVLCETTKCLPDAVQLLTSCTIGNGRLRILPLGRFALSLYHKDTGEGVRVHPDPARLEPWPAVKAWYLKLKSKREQDPILLLSQIREAGEACLASESILVKPEQVFKIRMGPDCGETYPIASGSCCLACQGESPYLQ